MSGRDNDDGYTTALDAARRAMASDVVPALLVAPCDSPTPIYASSAPSGAFSGLDVTQEAALREAARREADETAPGAKHRQTPHCSNGGRGAAKEQSGTLTDVMHSVLQQQQRSIAGCHRVPDPDKPPPLPDVVCDAAPLPDVVCDMSPAAEAPAPDAPLLVSDTHPYGFHDILVGVVQERAHAEYKGEVAELAYECAMLAMAVWLTIAVY